MAPTQTTQRQPGSSHDAVRFDRLDGVGRTCGPVSAVRPQGRTYQFLVNPDRGGCDTAGEGRCGHGLFPTTGASAVHNSSKGRSATRRSAMMTNSIPCSIGRRASACRRRRLMRFRVTAFPADRPTTSPARVSPSGEAALTMVRPPRRMRRPDESTRRKSSDRRSEAGSRGEALAPLAAPGIDDSSAGSRPHAVPESMLALPAAHLGLIRSLHDEVSPGDRWTSGGTPVDRPRLRSLRDLCQSSHGLHHVAFTVSREKKDGSAKTNHDRQERNHGARTAGRLWQTPL